MNFCAATWESTTKALVEQGYRVIAVDQIGFCKSTKPDAYQFTLQQLARNTRDLLASLNVTKPILIGHSTGGMLAIRYALMYPTEVERLVLVDPNELFGAILGGNPSLPYGFTIGGGLVLAAPAEPSQAGLFIRKK